MNRYNLNAHPVVSVSFTDEDGVATNPTTVTLVVTLPDATQATYTNADLDNPSVGTWQKTLIASQAGTWTYEWTGAGAVTAFDSGSFGVGAPAGRPPGGVCTPWAVQDDVCGSCVDLDPLSVTAWLDVASTVLYELTGRRWPGECSETVYPTGEECLSWLGRPPYFSNLRRRGFKLPGYPVTGVEQVVINGDVVDPDRYRVDDGRWLIYIPPVPYSAGDRQNWPDVNDERLALGSVGTWSIEYSYGYGPPPGGKEMAASLGCELAKSCSDPDGEGGECRLPARVTSITRQGVSMAVLDPLTLFSDGLVGLPECDLWIAAMNLGVKRRPAALVVPGRRRSVWRTEAT